MPAHPAEASADAQADAPPAAPSDPTAPADRHAAAEARIAELNVKIRAARAALARAAAPPPSAPRRRGGKRIPGFEHLVCRDVSATGWTAAKQRAFLDHLAGHGCVSQAAASVGLSKQSAYALRRRGGRSIFALAWDVAVRTARKALFDEAMERALVGRELPIWYRGEQVGTRIVHNDRLLMQLLAHKLPAAHPNYDDEALAQLWPMLLAQVDAELPISADAVKVMRRNADLDENGNDDEDE